MIAARRQPGVELKRFLGAFGPEIAKVALRVRAFVIGQAPLADELVDDASNAAAMRYSFTGRPSDAFCHIAVYPDWVNLGFHRGSQIPDPQGLLEGTGGSIRHIRIESLDDLHAPHVGRFLRAAIQTAPGRGAAGTVDRTAPQSAARAVSRNKRRPAQAKERG